MAHSQTSSTAGTTVLPSPLQTKIDTYVEQLMERGPLPGVSLVVVREQEIAYSQGYGFADLAEQRPLTVQTPVAIGSTTKSMTALAVMQLVEQGKIQLDTPVREYLPFFRPVYEQGGRITVRHLLTHTSALPASFPAGRTQSEDALEQQVRSFAQIVLKHTPGSQFEYSNDGYALLGLLVQQLSGISYEEYLQTHLFAPLEMFSTTFDLQEAARRGLAQGYVKRRGVLTPEETPFTRLVNPAGMAISTANDVGHYLLALLNEGKYGKHTLIAASSLEEMWRPSIHVGGDLAYGFGWYILHMGGMRVIAHTGDIVTSGSAFALVPDAKIGVGVLVTRDTSTKDEIAKGVLGLLFGQEPVVPEKPGERKPATFTPDYTVWDTYTGAYESKQGVIHLSRAGERLIGTILNSPFELEALSQTEFLMHSDLPALDESEVMFKITSGEPTRLFLQNVPFGVKKKEG